MIYALQTRWRLHGRVLLYYGLRNKEKLLQNRITLSRRQAEIVRALPGPLGEREKKLLSPYLGEQIVPESELRTTPTSLSEARFCTNCMANDFFIPGIEFDEQGRCPLCQTADEAKALKSIVPTVEEIPRAKHSRFDVALFYTGGKDSSFLLYYLSKVKKLRVLALTWEIPFASQNAKQSMENAKKYLPNVEFMTRTMSRAALKPIYQKLWELSGNPCACPSLAYVLFYPELVESRVPYFIVGNEPAQLLGLYYNNMAPRYTYALASRKTVPFWINAGRILTLHPPLRQGQMQTLFTMRQLTGRGAWIRKLASYSNELAENVIRAIGEEPLLTEPLSRAIRRSSWSGRVPAFVQLDFDTICPGGYDWTRVKEILIAECGWVPPDDAGKALHTSCCIERCKEYSQFRRFYHCESQVIPFSALEICLAARNKNLSREEAAYEMEHVLGFSLEEVAECSIVREYLEEQR